MSLLLTLLLVAACLVAACAVLVLTLIARIVLTVEDEIAAPEPDSMEEPE